jgi:hypothetical protein
MIVDRPCWSCERAIATDTRPYKILLSIRSVNQTTGKGAKVFVSSIAAFELWYGVAKSSRQDFNRND